MCAGVCVDPCARAHSVQDPSSGATSCLLFFPPQHSDTHFTDLGFFFQNGNWDSSLSYEERCSLRSWSLGPSAWPTCSGALLFQ